jgi:signal transduction histidine kinase
MQSILDEFLNFSRPLVPLNLASADLCTIVSEVCILHQGMSELMGVKVSLETQGPVEVFCDPRKVRQILVNLFQNALDAAAARGHISIRVQFSGEQAEIDLSDDGGGLDPELAERVFEAGVTKKVGGSGLGLNVARGLARQHGGDVTLVNRPSGGCTALLTLPLRPLQLDGAIGGANTLGEACTGKERPVAP